MMPKTVLIDGVLYAPVSDAAPNMAILVDALCARYMGVDWREKYPSSPDFLYVTVGQPEEVDDSDETVTMFVARLIQMMASGDAIDTGAEGEGP